jgi:hypothetical protein
MNQNHLAEFNTNSVRLNQGSRDGNVKRLFGWQAHTSVRAVAPPCSLLPSRADWLTEWSARFQRVKKLPATEEIRRFPPFPGGG